MDAPRPLVGTTEEGQLFVDKSTIEALTKITEDIAVISIVGKYRTGKSYLMNRLFDSNKGFQVGPTVSAATKGIWIWAREHPKYPSKKLLVLDIEGLHDPKKGEPTHDMKLFSLAVLLSSCLVYNVLGALDSAFLQEFHLVSKLTDFIRVDAKTEETGTEYSQHFPKLFFILRDFFLELNLNGKQITPDEYMDDTLKLKPGRGKAVNDYNEPRECIRDFFPKRACFVLPRPILKNPDDLAHLDQISDDEIDQDFLTKVTEAIDCILTEAQEFKVLGHVMNGARFVHLLRVYISGLNRGSLPPIVTAIENVKAKQCRMAINNSLQLYKQMMTSSLEGCFPIESLELMELHKAAYNMAVEQYKEQAMVDVKSAATLKEIMEEAYKKFQKENDEISKAKCLQLIETLFEFTANPGMFHETGGFTKYQSYMKSAVEDYNNTKHKGPMADEILRTFLREKAPIQDNILNADQEPFINMSVSEEQKAQFRQSASQQRRMEDEESEEQYKKKLRMDLLRQQEENMKMFDKMRKEFEARQEYLMQKYKDDIKAKEAEHRRLQDENMAKQSEKMEILLQRMHDEFKAKDQIIQKQQKQLETFKEKTELLVRRLESEKITKEELLATVAKSATPRKTTCTSPIPDPDSQPGPPKRRKSDLDAPSTSKELPSPIPVTKSDLEMLAKENTISITSQSTATDTQGTEGTASHENKKFVQEAEKYSNRPHSDPPNIPEKSTAAPTSATAQLLLSSLKKRSALVMETPTTPEPDSEKLSTHGDEKATVRSIIESSASGTASSQDSRKLTVIYPLQSKPSNSDTTDGTNVEGDSETQGTMSQIEDESQNAESITPSEIPSEGDVADQSSAMEGATLEGSTSPMETEASNTESHTSPENQNKAVEEDETTNKMDDSSSVDTKEDFKDADEEGSGSGNDDTSIESEAERKMLDSDSDDSELDFQGNDSSGYAEEEIESGKCSIS